MSGSIPQTASTAVAGTSTNGIVVNSNNSAPSWLDWLCALLLAFGLTCIFWWPLWTGSGLIGGDLYSYFMPQKQYLAEALQSGHLPLWNNRSGFGYPAVAESQTGVFYPPDLLLYSRLNPERAYVLNQLLHYVLAFAGCWRLARELRLSQCGALLAATAFVYGWFPPRICLEWGILTGAWMPLALFWCEHFLRTGRQRSLVALSLTLAMQMLAGHFHLAFITQLLIAAWLPLRLWFSRDNKAEAISSARGRSLLFASLAMLLGFGLAAAQLLPTLELKQLSQREDAAGPDFNPADGHIPPVYLSQLVASWWYWYSLDVDRDRALEQLQFLKYPTITNQVEAHLYVGLVPLLLIALALMGSRARAVVWNRTALIWLMLSFAAMVYTTGWLIPVMKHLPGFGFFRGPGRYGIITTLGLSMLAGASLTALLPKQPFVKFVLAAAALGLTTADLRQVASVVTYAFPLHVTPIQAVEHSPVLAELKAYQAAHPARLVRLYAPGPNLTNLFAVSSVPEYLGIGPAEYFDPQLRIPPLDQVTEEWLTRARRAGITHVLSFEPLPPLPIEQRAQLDGRFLHHMDLIMEVAGPDYFLNFAWARGKETPNYLYEITGTRGRVTFETQHSGQSLELKTYEPDDVVIHTQSSEPETVLLLDLFYPGWSVTIDDQPAEAVRFEGQFRAVRVPAGQHTIHWQFRPASIRIGLLISGLSLLVAAVWFGVGGREKSPMMLPQSR